MKLGSKHIKILGALAALWLGVFTVSGASASSLDGASGKTFKLNYFAKQSSWMPSALSPTGSQDALIMSALSLPGAVTWADYETWGKHNSRWSGPAEQITSYKKVVNANVRLLNRILLEDPGLVKQLRSEVLLNEGGSNSMVSVKVENPPVIYVRINENVPPPSVIPDSVGLPPPEDTPPASGS